MIPGYNHNIRFADEIWHIQTEDSGRNNPHIITLLYKGGNIIARKKVSYADILENQNVEDVVRSLMQEQHKAMLRDLKGGVFSGKAPEAAAPKAPAAAVPAAAPTAAAPVPEHVPPAETPMFDLDNSEVDSPFGADLISNKSLDEVILGYLAMELKEDK
ncbi:MAG: hypothetical protein KIT79_00175 [Deltaproteobacteria bacterium]|nr:hypothetical protein [Deltaproteobacteria bacterium]